MPEATVYPHRIALKTRLEQVYEEALANAALTPGHLIAMGSNGKVAKHAAAGKKTAPMFALEDALQGRTIDTAFAGDELVPYMIGESGDIFYAFLKNGQNVAKGAQLMSNGDGTFTAYAADTEDLTGNAQTLTVEPNHALVTAEEAVEADGADARIKVRVI